MVRPAAQLNNALARCLISFNYDQLNPRLISALRVLATGVAMIGLPEGAAQLPIHRGFVMPHLDFLIWGFGCPAAAALPAAVVPRRATFMELMNLVLGHRDWEDDMVRGFMAFSALITVRIEAEALSAASHRRRRDALIARAAAAAGSANIAALDAAIAGESVR